MSSYCFSPDLLEVLRGGNDLDDVICHVNITANQKIRRRQVTRQEILRKACEDRRKPSVDDVLNRILVDEKHQSLYCFIPKVGCTNWKTLLVQLIGKGSNTTRVHKKNDIAKAGLVRLSQYSEEDASHFLETYFKFMFVRDPFERLLSAYKDKFATYNEFTKHFQTKYGRDIIKTYRKNPSLLSLRLGHDVTFGEFVKYVIDSYKNNEEFNPHWRPFLDLCGPCDIHWDFIGKMETIEEDSRYVLSHMLGDPCPPPLMQSQHGHQTTVNVTKTFYEQIPSSDITKLAEVFHDDIELFGYQDGKQVL